MAPRAVITEIQGILLAEANSRVFGPDGVGLRYRGNHWN